MAPDFIHKVETVMKDSGEDTASLARVLTGLSSIYEAGIKARNLLYGRKWLTPRSLPCPVVSIGNITVGGTGKTPMTIFLARKLHESGFKPVILSRGYGGTASEKGGLVSDGQKILMNPSESGDEPFMMAEALPGVPVCIGKNRYQAGLDACSRFSPDLFILDDGFQHRRLYRDLDILLLDAEKPFGNGRLLPRGPLREPIDGIERAGIFVLTRSSHDPSDISRFKDLIVPYGSALKPVYTCSHDPFFHGLLPSGGTDITECQTGMCEGRSVFAFSGIAKNDDFRKGLEKKGLHVNGFMDFPDHHPYSPDDMKRMISAASDLKCGMLATTLKDMARIRDKVPFPMDLLIMNAGISFGPLENDFLAMVRMKTGLTSTQRDSVE